MEDKATILLFSNKEEIIDVTHYFDYLFNPNVEINDTNWIFYFDQYRAYKFVSCDEIHCNFEGGIFVIYDGTNLGNLNIDAKKISLLKQINDKSDRVHIVFHNFPSENIKREIRNIFSTKSSEPLNQPMHKRAFIDRNNVDDEYLFYKIYNGLFDLFYERENTLKITPGTLYDGKQIISVDGMIDVIIKKVGVNRKLNIKLELLHKCLLPESASKITLPMELKEYEDAFKQVVEKSRKIQNLEDKPLMHEYANCLRKFRDIMFQDSN